MTRLNVSLGEVQSQRKTHQLNFQFCFCLHSLILLFDKTISVAQIIEPAWKRNYKFIDHCAFSQFQAGPWSVFVGSLVSGSLETVLFRVQVLQQLLMGFNGLVVCSLTQKITWKKPNFKLLQQFSSLKLITFQRVKDMLLAFQNAAAKLTLKKPIKPIKPIKRHLYFRHLYDWGYALHPQSYKRL